MKNWRDWLRERWPHWRPFPIPIPEEARVAFDTAQAVPNSNTLVIVLTYSKDLVKDVGPEVARTIVKRAAEDQVDNAMRAKYA